ncbi:unnamed protein product [Mytilus edulis]|uniref:Uncharacterized protein n=1 Tax=Mytilus edulis TaxID=6550 RepID=A0A8S3RC37_MYTED|nr:unnamed protein product [Mytilus edulis]
MFVMAKEDIKDNAENRYECFGIVIPDNLLQQYMERWFQRLTKSSNLETFINKNRPIKNVTFRIALNEYMRQFNTEKIASFIWNANGAFINSMFIITDKDIKDNTENRYECFGIVIPDNLLQQYIERWFKDKDFINTMFVMAEQDIKDNAENRHECFGIVIPDDLLQQYIERWFKDLTKTWSVEYVMCDSRLLKNIMFRTSLCNYIRQLDTEKIASLILNADEDFINTMFVMAEQDIKDIAENRHECFGIVIPDNLLQQYMERWFQRLTKTSDLETFINKNRPIKNVTFRIALNEYMRQFNTEKIASLIWNANGDFINTMFVMADKPINVNTENRLECFGIVIPDDLLQQYIERWVQCLTKTKQLETYIDKSRPLKDITFRIALNKYMKQLNTDKIASLIWNTDGEFINTMFAMAEEDIKNNTDNRYECFGIVISDDLLKQYIDRWFERLTKTNGLEKYIDKNRPMKNVTFRIAFSDYLRKLVIEKIASLIWNADGEFINTMFVMAEEDIKDNAENRVECFGIVIPGDLLQQYIERLFECLTKTGELENFINNNRPIKNVTFRIAFSDYFRQLNTEK